MRSLSKFVSVQCVESCRACFDRRTSSICLLLCSIYFTIDLLLFIDVILGSRLKLVVWATSPPVLRCFSWLKLGEFSFRNCIVLAYKEVFLTKYLSDIYIFIYIYTYIYIYIHTYIHINRLRRQTVWQGCATLAVNDSEKNYDTNRYTEYGLWNIKLSFLNYAHYSL